MGWKSMYSLIYLRIILLLLIMVRQNIENRKVKVYKYIHIYTVSVMLKWLLSKSFVLSDNFSCTVVSLSAYLNISSCMTPHTHIYTIYMTNIVTPVR